MPVGHLTPVGRKALPDAKGMSICTGKPEITCNCTYYKVESASLNLASICHDRQAVANETVMLLDNPTTRW